MEAGVVVEKPQKVKRTQNYRENLTGWIFVGPMLLGTLFITLIPIIASVLISFTDWSFIRGVGDIRFVGLGNFQKLSTDETFLTSMKNNFILMLAIPVAMAVSLLLAILINGKVYFKDLFKIVYFMPYISSVVGVAVVFQVLFHPSLGPINQFLTMLGVDNPPKWLADIHFSLPSVMLILIWVQIGFNMIIYMAGLQNIPKDLYEAASIDGATSWQQFKRITLPMISSTTFFLLVTGVVYSFKVFDLIAVLTKGGPANSSSVMVYYLYEVAFTSLKTGYASAIAMVLFVCVLAITLIQWLGQRKWVNY
ncbi:binding-protein-dependent transport systems inner membrane component [Paenibacillus curdlanolyticus YK9]|uniref:Binding-protein-dependent transport systems inner membrane component n=1 Tax=Paenibacillus curdlanolyticus YK9 TaxID=717606 RepID=E0IAR2_9BACL|nr:sugar ABC transporter permease [Paenibacillus curdlanolyticus]EFM10466.1 binding-protein-dependent transport systems inner membrane component [Paenibacillus curdlanolyticus YK9]